MTFEELEKKIKPGTSYRHYKGEIYTVDFIAVNKSACPERLVVVYHNSSGMHYARTFEDFTDIVSVQRFSPLEEETK